MTWTKTVPTVRGHYWARMEDDQPTILHLHDPEHLLANGDKGWWYFMGDEQVGNNKDVACYEFWSEPLSPP